jgi:predicted exporter
LEKIQHLLNKEREPLWLIIRGQDESAVAHRLNELQALLTRAVSNHSITDFKLPAPLWPQPAFQAANRATAHRLAAEREVLRQAARMNGFAESSLGLTEGILDTWQTASTTSSVFWPSNQMSRWIFEKVAACTFTNCFALGLLNPAASAGLGIVESELPHGEVWLSGWELLGSAIFSRVKANMWKVLAPMLFLILLSLGLAFRRPAEIALSLAVLLFSGLCLLTVMRLAGWSWNLLNLMAIPLILGTGVDYSIFMQLALRRYQGDLSMAYRSVGRALLLCGGTAIAGFGSLSWSSNAGMASLGQVCAVGVGSNMLIAIFLLPVWWQKLVGMTYEKANS